MVLKYNEHWSSDEKRDAVARLKKRYGGAFIGKAMHDILTYGHKSVVLDMLYIKAKDPEGQTGWVAAARGFLMDYGRDIYNRVTQFIETNASWRGLVSAQIVPDFLVTLYERAVEMTTAVGLALRKASLYVYENLDRLWSLISSYVFPEGDGDEVDDPELNDEARELLGISRAEPSWLRQAVSHGATFSTTYIYLIGKGIADVAAAILNLVSRGASALMSATTALNSAVMSVPTRFSDVVYRSKRRAIYMYFLVMCGISEMGTWVNENGKDFLNRHKKLLQTINDALENTGRWLNRVVLEPVGELIWAGVVATPVIGNVVIEMGWEQKEILWIVTNLAQKIAWIVDVINKIWQRPLAVIGSYVQAALPSFVDVIQALFRKVGLMSDYTETSNALDIKRVKEQAEIARKWGTSADFIPPDAAVRCLEAAEAADDFIEQCETHQREKLAAAKNRPALEVFRDVTLSAELLTRLYFDEEITEVDLDEVTQLRYGLPYKKLLDAGLTIQENLTVQIGTATLYALNNIDRGNQAMSMGNPVTSFVELMRKSKRRPETADGDFAAEPIGLIFDSPPSELLTRYKMVFGEEADVSLLTTVAGLRQIQERIRLMIENAVGAEELVQIKAKSLSAEVGFSIAEGSIQASTDMLEKAKLDLTNLSKAIAEELNTIDPRVKLYGQLEVEVLNIRERRNRLRRYLAVGALVVTGIAIYYLVSDNTKEMESEEAARNLIVGRQNDGKEDEIVAALLERFKQHEGTDKLNLRREDTQKRFLAYLEQKKSNLETGFNELGNLDKKFAQMGPPMAAPPPDLPLAQRSKDIAVFGQKPVSPITDVELKTTIAENADIFGLVTDRFGIDQGGLFGKRPIGQLPVYTEGLTKGERPQYVPYVLNRPNRFFGSSTTLVFPMGFGDPKAFETATLEQREIMILRAQHLELGTKLQESITALKNRREQAFLKENNKAAVQSALTRVTNWWSYSTGVVDTRVTWDVISTNFERALESIGTGGGQHYAIVAGYLGVGILSLGSIATFVSAIMFAIVVVSNAIFRDWEENDWHKQESTGFVLNLLVYFFTTTGANIGILYSMLQTMTQLIASSRLHWGSMVFGALGLFAGVAGFASGPVGALVKGGYALLTSCGNRPQTGGDVARVPGTDPRAPGECKLTQQELIKNAAVLAERYSVALSELKSQFAILSQSQGGQSYRLPRKVKPSENRPQESRSLLDTIRQLNQ